MVDWWSKCTYAMRQLGVQGLLIAAATRLLSWLPLMAGRRCAAWLGWLLHRAGTAMATVTRINLSRCFPELSPGALEELTRASLEHTGCLLFEAGPLAHWPSGRLARLVVSETGRDELAARLGAGGVLMLVPHFGNWEFICFALGPFKFVALYDPPRVGSLEGALRRSRERFGGRLRPADVGGLRAAYRELDAGGLVCVLPDQVPERPAGAYAPFFGQPALTMTLAHRLIRRTRPTVMLGSARRVRNGFALAYEPLGKGLRAAGPDEFALALNQAIEGVVRRDPAQYQWEYKRFKKQPPGHAAVYPKR